MVKTWDISAGLCKASLQTPAGDNTWRDVRLIDDRLIVVWCEDDEIYVWGTIKDNEPIQLLFCHRCWLIRHHIVSLVLVLTLPYSGHTVQGSKGQYCLYHWVICQCIGLQNVQTSWVLH